MLNLNFEIKAQKLPLLKGIRKDYLILKEKVERMQERKRARIQESSDESIGCAESDSDYEPADIKTTEINCKFIQVEPSK